MEVNNEFQSFCTDSGILLNYTVPYTPEQNGIAERYNRTILEKTRSGAVQTANYLLNRSPTRALTNERHLKTPAELWYGKKPNLKYIRVFGCSAYYHVPKENRKKLDEKAIKSILMGYAPNGYRLWDPEKQRIVISRDVTFDETFYPKPLHLKQNEIQPFNYDESSSSSAMTTPKIGLMKKMKLINAKKMKKM